MSRRRRQQADRRLNYAALANDFKSLLALFVVAAAPMSRRGAAYMRAFRTAQPLFDSLATIIRPALRPAPPAPYEGGGIP